VSIRVLVVDDHAVVRSGLRRVLEAEADIEVVGEAGTADQAIYETGAAKPESCSSTWSCPVAAAST
jgi:two-component system response regulator DevR